MRYGFNWTTACTFKSTTYRLVATTSSCCEEKYSRIGWTGGFEDEVIRNTQSLCDFDRNLIEIYGSEIEWRKILSRIYNCVEEERWRCCALRANDSPCLATTTLAG